jgi:GR25 family glycosyltransferase involved in LPS biosynthesis
MDWHTFDAIYLINLPERADRKRELERELRRVGLQIDDPKLVWVRAARPSEAGGFPSIGARGCFLSHLSCLQSASERGYGRILILEDDAYFPRFRIKDLETVLEKLKRFNWAIWYGGARHELNVMSTNTEVIPIEYTAGVQTSHCIALQGNAIRSVRDFLELILTRPGGHPEAGPMHVDGAYSTWRGLNPTAVTLVTLPPVCSQRSSQSDIGVLHWYDRTPLVRRVIATFRRVRNWRRIHYAR